MFFASLWEVSRRNKKVEERDWVCVTVWEKQISLTAVCNQVLRIWSHFKILVINTIMIMMAMLSLFRHIHFAFFPWYFWIPYCHSVSLGPLLEIVGCELGFFCLGLFFIEKCDNILIHIHYIDVRIWTHDLSWGSKLGLIYRVMKTSKKIS